MTDDDRLMPLSADELAAVRAALCEIEEYKNTVGEWDCRDVGSAARYLEDMFTVPVATILNALPRLLELAESAAALRGPPARQPGA
jgi:hypothetical protein